MLAALSLGVGTGRADIANSFPEVVFTDGFEAGHLDRWNQVLGDGSSSITADAPASGDHALRLLNAPGQYSLVTKQLGSGLPEYSTRFRFKASSTTGFVTVAQGREANSSGRTWEIIYDAPSRGFYFYPYKSTGSVEIFTGGNSAPVANTWMELEIRVNAAEDGGARIYINGQSQPSWGVTGDFSRAQHFAILQLWNDGPDTNAFDDVIVAKPSPAAREPGAPRALTGSAGNGAVALEWTAPTTDGGSSITGYRITPYRDGAAQSPRFVASTATHADVSGLINGATYTFTVSAVNAVGTGPESALSPAYMPRGEATAPGAPGLVGGVEGVGLVDLSWAVPADDGGREITGYRITPYIGTQAQATITTASAQTHRTIDGLVNGTAYTFRVAAINSVGAGQNSDPSVPLTPNVTRYTDPILKADFDSGILSGWNQLIGNGNVSVAGAAARQGAYGLRLENGPGQFTLAARPFGDSLPDSSTKFWMRTTATSGLITVAQARDGGSSSRMWELLYDASTRGFYFYPYRASGSVERSTGTQAAPAPGTWMQIEIRYDAATNGGAQLFIDGKTKETWGAEGNFERSSDYAILQLWNDGAGTVDFDDVAIAKPVSGLTVPAAPTDVAGSTGDGVVNLSWAAPTDDGGSPISGYRITPYIGAQAQPSVLTASSATNATLELENGTEYTFTVAAINALGTGPDSEPSAPREPRGEAGVPDAPAALAGTAGNGRVSLDWHAPADDGGSPLTGYRLTPYIDGQAQAPIDVTSLTTHRLVTGLTNGVTYTFRVAGVNAVGIGANSNPTPNLTPSVPRVVVSIQFDDGVATQYQTRAMLAAHNMHATYYVNSGLTGDAPGAWRMTWSQLRGLAADGNEIGGHTLDHPDLTTLPTASAQFEICQDRQNLLAQGFAADSFAYPYGGFEQSGVPGLVGTCGYTSGRTVGGIRSSRCPGCATAETIPPADAMVTRTPPDVRKTDTVATIQEYVMQAEENGGGWVQLVFHDVCSGDDCDTYSVSPPTLNAFLDWLQPRASNGTIVKTVGQVTNGM